jgi:CheY-like chemotaxis protein
MLCEIAPDLPTRLQGDPGRLRQILTNLVSNAVKFTHRGEVLIRVAASAETDHDVTLRFTIEDTGIGEKNRCLIFQPFIQGDGSTTRQYGGTGHGLTICKNLVGLMSGQIGFESRFGAGSTFWFTARLAKQPGACNADPSPVFDGQRILVAEPHQNTREPLLRQLAHWGLRVETANTAHETITRLQKTGEEHPPFALIIVHTDIAGTSGPSIAQQITQIPDAPPLILLTPFGGRSSRTPAHAHSLTKPIKRATLLNALTHLLLPAAVRVLLAEDNLIHQKAAARQLERPGCHVTIVSNGIEALAAVQDGPFDAVLMDCQMPEMDGCTASSLIRQWEKNTPRPGRMPLPIIAITAHVMPGDREKCLAAGMNDYLGKPVKMNDLADALGRVLPRFRPEPLSARAAIL